MLIYELVQLGVSQTIVNRLQSFGYKELTEIQRTAIDKGLFNGKSMIVSSPTNTGKTFIAEIAIINNYKTKIGKRAFYLVPLKSIAEEKFDEFREKYADWGLKVAVSTSERDEFDSFLPDFDLSILTYEKLNALLTRSGDTAKQLGLVIIDEIQNLGDEHRGTALEILLTRILNLSEQRPQIIGLSATIPNPEDISNWLGCELVRSDRRGVELREGVLYTGSQRISFKGHSITDGEIIFKEFNTGKIEKESLDLNNMDVLKRVCTKEQVIIFENTRRRAEEKALRIAQELSSVGDISEILAEIDTKVESTPSLRDLKKCLLKGVAFHHAGLLHEEKKIIEKSFEIGKIRVIVTTTTLGAGVNTPAKNVVIISPNLYDGTSLPVRDYKNMAGRAGRIRFHDDFGRSVLFANTEKELEMLWHSYVNSGPESVESKIPQMENLQLHFLSLLASGECKSIQDLQQFIKGTFYGFLAAKNGSKDLPQDFYKSIEEQVTDLTNNGFLRVDNGKIQPTELGRRTAELQFSPETAKVLSSALRKLERIYEKKSLEELIEPIIHIVCCTSDSKLVWAPNSEQEKKEILIYWEKVKKNYLLNQDRSKQDDILKSVRTSQLLLRWVEGLSYSYLKIFAHQGDVKNIAESASWLLGGIWRFAEQPLFSFKPEFVKSLKELSKRIKHGVPLEAVEIMDLKIPAIHRIRAIKLSQNGFNSLNSLIESGVEDLVKVEGIGNVLATRIKEFCERFIQSKNKQRQGSQIRRAKELGRDYTLIERIYKETDDQFAKTIIDVIKQQLELACNYIGDLGPHEPDGLLECNGKIVIECKRKKNTELISALEAEEILGKGKKYNPVSYVVIGYPGFSETALANTRHTSVVLISHSNFIDILLNYWQGTLSKDGMINLFQTGTTELNRNEAKKLSG